MTLAAHYSALVQSALRLVFLTILTIILTAVTPNWGHCADKDAISFAPEIDALYRIVGCGGTKDGQKPEDVQLSQNHCIKLDKILNKYRNRWMAKAEPFFGKCLAGSMPEKIVNPFGGSDLTTLLIVFPEATEYTTISLEESGDPRPFLKLNEKELGASLALVRDLIKPYLKFAHHATKRLSKQNRSALSGELAVAMVALGLKGYAPVDLRYFFIDTDGSLKYITAEDVAAHDAGDEEMVARRIFSNMELTFVRGNGTDDHGSVTLRHIRQNLDNEFFTADSPLYKFLSSQGVVAGMLKAGSYLFPGRSFSNLRDYLMGNASLLVADCTGPTPKQAKKHGFKQTTYGKYLGHGSYVPQGRFYDKRLIAMWKSQPYRRLGFRFGYGDNAANGHLAIWRKSGDTKTQIPSEKKE